MQFGLIPSASVRVLSTLLEADYNERENSTCVTEKKPSPRGSPDVSYSLPAIKPDKEKASSPSSASSLPRSRSPSGSSWRTERGIIQRLKRLKSSRGLEFLRLPGAPEEGQTFTGKEKRGRKKINSLPESCRVRGEWRCRALGEFVL